MLIDKIPYNVDAERAVLGAIICGANIDIVLAEMHLKEDDFYVGEHKEIFKSMIQLCDKGVPIDIVSLHSILANSQTYTGIESLKKIASSSVTTRNVKYHTAIVKDLARRIHWQIH